MFSASYISKCIKYKKDIGYLILQARCPMKADQCTITAEIIAAGDAFHHPPTMGPSEYRIVKGVLGHDDIYAEDPIGGYPINECVILPTEMLLKAGLDALHWCLGQEAYDQGAEHLLDAIIESGRFGRAQLS